MILGMTLFTFVHVVLSLIGIFSGLIVLFGMFTAKPLDGWTALFLVTTAATSVTGFLFPFHQFMPSQRLASYRCWSWRLRFTHATPATSQALGVAFTWSTLPLPSI
jgi:hypothetical protein